MLGLGRRLKARNSIWDLVNKHPTSSLSPSQHPPHWTQPVEEGADGLPPLPISPTSPHSVAIPSLKLESDPLREEAIPTNMAPVS